MKGSAKKQNQELAIVRIKNDDFMSFLHLK